MDCLNNVDCLIFYADCLCGLFSYLQFVKGTTLDFLFLGPTHCEHAQVTTFYKTFKHDFV